MPALVVTLLALIMGYILMTKGPIVFTAAIATATSAYLIKKATDSDNRLLGLQTANISRLRSGSGWTRHPAEQKLLRDALSTALRRTELYNQYPNSVSGGTRLATRLGWA